MSSGRPTIRSLCISKSTLTMSKAELRSKLAIIVNWFESRALVISDCSSRPAVLVLCFLLKPYYYFFIFFLLFVVYFFPKMLVTLINIKQDVFAMQNRLSWIRVIWRIYQELFFHFSPSALHFTVKN